MIPLKKPKTKKTRYGEKLGYQARLPIEELQTKRGKWTDRMGIPVVIGGVGGFLTYVGSLVTSREYEQGVAILAGVVATAGIAKGVASALSPKQRRIILRATMRVKRGLSNVAREDERFLRFLQGHKGKFVIVDWKGRIEVKEKDRRYGIGRIRIQVNEILAKAEKKPNDH